MSARYLGSSSLPSSNSCHVYLGEDMSLRCEWDDPPSPAWPDLDRVHYEMVTFPAILRAVATKTGQNVLGVQLP